jgi:glutamate--cysteine ligase
VSSLFVPAGPAINRGEPGSVGVEVELIPVTCASWPPRPAPLPLVTAAIAHDPDLRADGRISFEPGGQLELSPPPSPTATGCLDQIETLLRRVRRCGDIEGITFLSTALSPWHDADEIGLQNDHPRYRAMQAHFDTGGPAGRRMMRQTASLQICVDLDGTTRWDLLNAIGPALSAAFAGSPVMAGRTTGDRSTRTAIWLDTDPTRTGFDGHHLNGDPAPSYTALALDAETILLPRNGSTPPSGVPLRALLEAGGGRPDARDLEHHLTTLFPPVRPHGYLEVRCLDAMPMRWLAVAVCLVATLTADPAAGRLAREAVTAGSRPGRDAWGRAAHDAVGDPALRDTALALFDIALAAIPRLPAGYVPDDAATRLTDYRDRFVSRGRCPADEILEQLDHNPEELATWM